MLNTLLLWTLESKLVRRFAVIHNWQHSAKFGPRKTASYLVLVRLSQLNSDLFCMMSLLYTTIQLLASPPLTATVQRAPSLVLALLMLITPLPWILESNSLRPKHRPHHVLAYLHSQMYPNRPIWNENMKILLNRQLHAISWYQ